jgi:hypothetical protein
MTMGYQERLDALRETVIEEASEYGYLIDSGFTYDEADTIMKYKRFEEEQYEIVQSAKREAERIALERIEAERIAKIIAEVGEEIPF